MFLCQGEFPQAIYFVRSPQSANNACRIIRTRNEPIDGEQAGFEDDESGKTAEPTEEDNRKDCEQDRAKDVSSHLSSALVSALIGCEIRHRALLGALDPSHKGGSRPLSQGQLL
jgi:hypothetical protein